MLGLFALLLLALAPLTAHAAGDPRVEAQARAKFVEGNAAYEKADFQTALGAYLEAYRLMPLPGFLFNIAQCHRQLGRPERAAIFYRRYLAQSKRPPSNAPLVRELIAEMDAAAAKEPPKSVALRSQAEEVAARRAREDSERKRAVAATPPTPEVQSESLAKKWWVWAGAGAVAIVAGGVIYAATAPEPRPTTLGTIR
ncbi:tetratricopeptide repeat protein [Melittangium boletus]|uniref:tetratricopeptide repeat protein n=1 Tax=Melittangium boletus TaxID=83453 RepID=UPI001FE463FE|nr:tetratricopeptide repeat protein [Melittangium boletus]